MRSNQPYLLRAFYDWIVDNQCTPYIIVDAFHESTAVPQEFVKDGQIVLNIAPRAVTNFDMSGDAITCSSRFGGVPVELFLPFSAVLGIYAQENGKGMMFDFEDNNDPTPPPSPINNPDLVKKSALSELSDQSKSKPSLRVVK
jgi:stringent starvation protein B